MDSPLLRQDSSSLHDDPWDAGDDAVGGGAGDVVGGGGGPHTLQLNGQATAATTPVLP
eukprot:COSAG04_NODE_2936_length_3371_cov_1.523533_1_plen_57_part_10